MTLERDEHGHPKTVGKVAIEELAERTGWALFTGCDGDTLNFHAFFVRKSSALAYMAHCNDPDADDYLFDPGLAPAAIVDGHIVAANHYDDELGAGVILRAAGIYGEDAERLRTDAAAPQGNGQETRR